MGKLEPVEFCGELRRETPQAYCVYDGANEVWIPKSQVREARQVGGNNSPAYEFVVPEWLAIEKGII